MINKKLTNYLNKELIPVFKESAHKYFSENFLDGFSWQNSENKKFLGAIKRNREFKSMEYYVKEYSLKTYGGYIYESYLELGDGLFHENKITGKGVFTFFHEIAHCWLNYKFQGNFDVFRNSGNRIQYNVAEGFCDFTSCDIIKRTKIRHLFPDSLKYSEHLEKAYSYLVNKIKYGSADEFCGSYLDKELENISTEYLLGYKDKKTLWTSNNQVRTKFFGIFYHYDTLKQKVNFLKNPPRTMQELKNYIPKIKN